MSNAIALTGAALDLALSNRERLGLLKDTICTDLTGPEFEVFIEVCNRRRLDPFCKQIYAIKRAGKVNHQTAIDGFRLIAQRSGEYEGQLGPFWCGEDGKWVDVWRQGTGPVAAKVGVFRRGFREPVWGVARTEAYNTHQGQWPKMPDAMIAKCAEALALRKAFPEELSGLHATEEIEDVEVKVLPDAAAPAAPARKPVSAKDLDAELLAPTNGVAKQEELVKSLEVEIATMTTRDERAAVRARLEAAGLAGAARARMELVWSERLAELKAQAMAASTAAEHRKAKEDRERREKDSKPRLPDDGQEYDEDGILVPPPRAEDDGR